MSCMYQWLNISMWIVLTSEILLPFCDNVSEGETPMSKQQPGQVQMKIYTVRNILTAMINSSPGNLQHSLDEVSQFLYSGFHYSSVCPPLFWPIQRSSGFVSCAACPLACCWTVWRTRRTLRVLSCSLAMFSLWQLICLCRLCQPFCSLLQCWWSAFSRTSLWISWAWNRINTNISNTKLIRNRTTFDVAL